jgi:hypothetical protein
MIRADLRPCPACARHARVSEAACPFCGARLDASFRDFPRRRAPTVRLSRAALFALGTGGAALAPACGSLPKDSLGEASFDGSSVDSGDDASDGFQNLGNPMGLYGGSPIATPFYGSAPIEPIRDASIDSRAKDAGDSEAQETGLGDATTDGPSDVSADAAVDAAGTGPADAEDDRPTGD